MLLREPGPHSTAVGATGSWNHKAPSTTGSRLPLSRCGCILENSCISQPSKEGTVLDRTQMGTPLRPSPHAQTSHVGTVEPRPLCLLGKPQAPWPRPQNASRPREHRFSHNMPFSAQHAPRRPAADAPTAGPAGPRRHARQDCCASSSGQQSPSRWGAAFWGP